MHLPPLFRVALRIAPAVLTAVGVVVGGALVWFSYRYVYRTMTTIDIPEPERLATALERIDPERVEALDAFFRATTALPALDPASVRDVFRAPGVDERPKS